MDHIRDRGDRLREMLLLTHHVQKTWEEMDTLRIADDLSAG